MTVKEYFKNKKIRLRCRKEYPDAHTHIMIGYVVDETENYIVIRGRTFHYRQIVGGMKNQVSCGGIMTRAVPWNNVEIIHELSANTDFTADFSFDQQGNLILSDTEGTVVALRRDSVE